MTFENNWGGIPKLGGMKYSWGDRSGRKLCFDISDMVFTGILVCIFTCCLSDGQLETKDQAFKGRATVEAIVCFQRVTKNRPLTLGIFISTAPGNLKLHRVLDANLTQWSLRSIHIFIILSIENSEHIQHCQLLHFSSQRGWFQCYL